MQCHPSFFFILPLRPYSHRLIVACHCHYSSGWNLWSHSMVAPHRLIVFYWHAVLFYGFLISIFSATFPEVGDIAPQDGLRLIVCFLPGFFKNVTHALTQVLCIMLYRFFPIVSYSVFLSFPLDCPAQVNVFVSQQTDCKRMVTPHRLICFVFILLQTDHFLKLGCFSFLNCRLTTQCCFFLLTFFCRWCAFSWRWCTFLLEVMPFPRHGLATLIAHSGRHLT